MEHAVARIDSGQFPDLPFPFARTRGHAVVGATETKHVANTARHVVQPVFSPLPQAAIALANLYLTPKPKRGLSSLFPSLHGAMLLCLAQAKGKAASCTPEEAMTS